MLGEVPATRLKLIEGIVAAAHGVSGKRLPAGAENFLRGYYRGVAEEDLKERDPAYLAAVALDHLRFGGQRKGKPLIRIFDPSRDRDGFASDHTLVMLVTDDMPFLVDSLGIVFSQAGIGVHFIVHPVLQVERDAQGKLKTLTAADAGSKRRESWQFLEIDRQLDPAKIQELERRILSTLGDVRAAVSDWRAMRERAHSLAKELDATPGSIARAEVREAKALLEWMGENHFTFLGYRHYRLKRGANRDTLVPTIDSGLGILRAPRPGVPAPEPTELTGELRKQAREPELLIVTKANSMATVHRATYLDYIGVKTFDAEGEVAGEHRFIGLWTSTAYHRNPREIPLLRHKVERAVELFGLAPDSHDAKAVMHALETYPRDELFQATLTELMHIVRGVVNLYERHRVRVFMRRDAFDRFYSCLVYVPRDRYNTDVRGKIEAILLKELGGQNLETQVQLSESTLARLHIVVRVDPKQTRKVDSDRIERLVSEATNTWADGLRDALIKTTNEATALEQTRRYAAAFPAAYQEDIEPRAALEDIADLEQLRVDPRALRLNLQRFEHEKPERMHLKIVKLGDPVPISDILPMLENFGLRVIAERPYELAWPDGGAAWVQDFELEHRESARIDITRIEPLFKEAFTAAWRAEVENDGFNRLLLAGGLSSREIVVLRAYCRYLLQTGIAFSQAYMERALANNAPIAKNLVRLFVQQFDPEVSPKADRKTDRIVAAIRLSLDAVQSLDEDRILRAYLNLILATLRTNFYQTDSAGRAKPYLCFKLDPQKIPDLPLPRPKFEIFVYSPRVEAVHLRMGYVARGGIRWSDRREDFRTEVLGLMKAQNVKNTVIVPMGAKGGFVVKRPPTGSREDLQREVVASYQTFIRGLLDVTDNIVNNKIVPPARVVRRDPDDAYLVVAADKGTATFSDTANAISLEYGFWLGDAFASGGSAGYDHKKMGITARGAWEAVKRHFREIGVNIQEQDFTVTGIGDMSGDVFGNGMLLSKHIRLRAAFNHQHIFLDPEPDVAVSFAERERLFALPRSTWADYDRKKISKGGGVYERSAKSIALSPQAQTMLGLPASATPTEIVRAILRMPVDLLWNGGIGTYVKAKDETNSAVGDRANDAVRINGLELKAKVVGEGGNLGLSQRGRVEYALAGGRLNTDFIDNSAGVNTSDVEVNIKILLNPLEQADKLGAADRNKLLARMTDEVAELVLRNNYLQSQAISTLELQSTARLQEYQHLIRALERSGELNRAIEFLPADDEFAERRKAGIGLTRPELAIVLSYSKIWLSHHLLASDVPEDPYLSNELDRYFPAPVRQRFPRAIPRHRLRREIIATATTNSLVNRMGPTFVPRAQEETGAEPAQIARAYTAAREIFDMRKLWAQIEALDNRVPARLQYEMMYQTSRLLRHMTNWLIAHRRRELHIDQAVAEFRKGVHELEEVVSKALVGTARERYEAIHKQHVNAGVPAELASRIASLDALNAALDVVELAGAHRTNIADTTRAYFDVGARIGLDWLRDQVERLPVDGPWQAVARTGLRDSALRIHRRIVDRVLARKERGGISARIGAWLESAGSELEHWQRTLTDMRSAGAADFATLTVGVESVRKLTD
jgi:glutamate dehydrogenase